MPLVDLADIEGWLAQKESTVPDLRAGCAKSIVWADKPATRTAYSILYVHGFSATGEELRPLPDLIAKDLGANLHFTRLNGHGQSGEAMGKATLDAWQDDIGEAFMVAQTIGEKVIVIGCSTGCTLITDALARGQMAVAAVFVSPNFGLRHRVAQMLLDMPLARRWGHLIAGREREFHPMSDAHAAYWTTRYPISAIYPMADAVRTVRGLDLSTVQTPAFVAYNPADHVVSPAATQRVMGRWGAAVTPHVLHQGPQDDQMGHVMAGDVFSPNQTAPLAQAILRWFSHR